MVNILIITINYKDWWEIMTSKVFQVLKTPGVYVCLSLTQCKRIWQSEVVFSKSDAKQRGKMGRKT